MGDEDELRRRSPGGGVVEGVGVAVADGVESSSIDLKPTGYSRRSG